MIFAVFAAHVRRILIRNKHWTKSMYSIEDRALVKVDSLYRCVLRKKASEYHGE